MLVLGLAVERLAQCKAVGKRGEKELDGGLATMEDGRVQRRVAVLVDEVVSSTLVPEQSDVFDVCVCFGEAAGEMKRCGTVRIGDVQ